MPHTKSRYLFSILTLLLFAPLSQAAEVTHGPILGRISSNGIKIWARTSMSAELSVRFGKKKRIYDQEAESVTTLLNDDLTGVVTLSGLEPETEYHYQMLVDGRESGLPGSFKTLPSSEDYIDPEFNPEGLFNFRFEFACGNNQNRESGIGPTLPTYDTLLRDVRKKIDFAILNGDWLYEENRDYPLEKWQVQVDVDDADIPAEVVVAPTVVGVWENYKTYLARARNLAEWHRYVPSFFTFDDHELVNDLYGSGEVGRTARRAVFRDISLKGWYDYLGWSNPVATEQGISFGKGSFEQGSDILFDPDADFSRLDLSQAATLHVHWGSSSAGMHEFEADEVPGDPNSGVYGIVEVLDRNRLKITPAAKSTGQASYSIGRMSYGKFRVANCDFYLLDTRTHREMHDVRDPQKKGLSMLGMAQREWLMREMSSSDADFMFVVSSVNFMIPHIGGGGVEFDVSNKDDAWTVFLDEREILINFWDQLGKPVMVLTGDLHNSFVIKITDRVWEFASGPHNSVNHRPSDEGDRPVTGRYQYGPRPCEIRWSSYCLGDIPRPNRLFPTFCVVQINNVFNNPIELDGKRWVAYDQPQVIFQYYDGFTGDLRYAEAISMTGESELIEKAWSARPQESITNQK